MQPSGGSQVRPGHTATFSIIVWTTQATSKDTAATIKVRPAAHVGSPEFTVCPSASGARCSLGNLPVGRAVDLLARVTVSSQAAPGEHVELIADASSAGAASVSSAATVLVAGRAAPSPSSGTGASGGATDPAAAPLPFSVFVSPFTLPALAEAGVTLTDPASLFPTVSPGASPSARPFLVLFPFPSETAQPRRSASHVDPETTAALLPRGPKLIGVEAPGGAIAAIATGIALSRLSRRMRRPAKR